jgi:hypothetical protein
MARLLFVVQLAATAQGLVLHLAGKPVVGRGTSRIAVRIFAVCERELRTCLPEPASMIESPVGTCVAESNYDLQSRTSFGLHIRSD